MADNEVSCSGRDNGCEINADERFFWDTYLNARGRLMTATLTYPTIKTIVLDALRAYAMHEVFDCVFYRVMRSP